jgi:iron complex outermembrane recepter protein
MSFQSFARHLCCAALSTCACAQTNAQTNAQAPEQQLPEVLITGNPLSRPDGTVAASRLAGDELVIRRQSSLGETLQQLPGVSSTYFGPNASRPSIRGLDGDRIRILQNGGASLDASSLSFDHAVPIDPMSMEKVEVLRGSAALLYGGSAAGGVVNIIDSRIAREAVFPNSGGVSGMGAMSLGSNQNRELSMRVDAGTNQWVWHADAFTRNNHNIGAPGAACDERICNSAQAAQGAGLGTSLLFDGGYLGTSLSHFSSRYGTVAEPTVEIAMRKQRFSIEGAQTIRQGFLESAKGQWNYARYSHTEWDGSLAGSVFGNRGQDMRLEAVQREIAFGNGENNRKLKGSFGVQAEHNRFDASGPEAYLPPSKASQYAVFLFEELSLGTTRYNAGLRAEQVSVKALGTTQQQLSFRPGSASLGANWAIGTAVEVSTSLASSQRAPRDYELFANGPHVATAAWELGSSSLKKEQSTKFELGTAWKSGANRISANLFSSYFSRYIALYRTANTRGKDGELNPVDANQDGVADQSGETIVPEFAYRPVRARLSGLELQGKWRLASTGPKWDLDWLTDTVRANNLDSGEPLPRIAPLRIGSGVSVQSGAFRARLGAMYYARQSRVPSGDLASAAYTLWNLEFSYRHRPIPNSDLLWFVRVENLADRRAFSSSSMLTQTAPGKAPLPGRSVRIGVQGNL